MHNKIKTTITGVTTQTLHPLKITFIIKITVVYVSVTKQKLAVIKFVGVSARKTFLH